MKVHVFAILKDYFEKEFEVEEVVQNARGLKERLIRNNPASAGVLDICRFAVEDEFIDDEYQFNENDTIYIIPPGSGG